MPVKTEREQFVAAFRDDAKRRFYFLLFFSLPVPDQNKLSLPLQNPLRQFICLQIRIFPAVKKSTSILKRDVVI